jgi:hypothetical protein
MAVEVHEALIIERAFPTKARCRDVVNAQGLVVVQGLTAAEAHTSLFFGESPLPTGKLGMLTRSSPHPIVSEGWIIWRCAPFHKDMSNDRGPRKLDETTAVSGSIAKTQ